MKFQIIAGRHAMENPSNPKETLQYKAKVLGRDGNEMPPPRDEDPRDFSGDIIETDTDLCAKFNRPGSVKFVRLPDEVPSYTKNQDTPVAQAAREGFYGETKPVSEANTATVNDNLETLSVKDLQNLAAVEEIDIKGETNKQKIIKIIRAGR